MEERLGLPISPTPLPDGAVIDEPGVESEEVKSRINAPESDEWKKECDRALGDVWLIARSRLSGLGKS